MPFRSGPRSKQIWMAVFFLGAALVNYPFLKIFDRPITVGGVPLIFLYFMCGWFGGIIVIFLYSRILGISDSEED